MPAFLFDLDGTLVDTETENVRAVVEVLGRRGRVLDAEERAFIVGHGWRDIHARLCRRPGREGDVGLGLEELIALVSDVKEAMIAQDGLRAISGAIDFARRAAGHGPVAVVSGSSRREIAFCLERVGLGDLFPWFIAFEDVRSGKPAPEGYLRAAERLGVAPAECIVFEDSAAGVAAARAAGMRVVALEEANHLGADLSAADRRVRSFLDLDDSIFEGKI